MKNKYIGDGQFYRRVLRIAVPIMLQQGITNFVSFLDNIMVGRIGTEQMSGVAIVNQLIFVFYLCIFGGFAGAGIFTAQFYGKGDREGIRHTIRWKLILGMIIMAVFLAVFLTCGRQLAGLFLMGNSDAGDNAAALEYAMSYMYHVMPALLPFILVQVYSTTLRECSETLVPMKASMAAVLTNMVLNYVLIFGKLGMPALGVKGAAIATVLARFTELFIVVGWTISHRDKCPYMEGAFRSLRVPAGILKDMIKTGMPLLLNEGLWSSGIAVLVQCYSLQGLNAVAAQNISTTVSNVFNVIFFAMGDAIAIIVGQHLGAGRLEQARDEDTKIMALSVFIGVMVGIIIFSTSSLFPMLYNTTDEARTIASHFLIAQAIFTPQIAFLHTAYFTVRAGGNTIVTFFFDSFFLWVANVPLAYVLSRYTSLYVVWIFAAVQMSDWIKCVIGYILVKRGGWIRNIVDSR